jgi:hypothetical protein
VTTRKQRNDRAALGRPFLIDLIKADPLAERRRIAEICVPLDAHRFVGEAGLPATRPRMASTSDRSQAILRDFPAPRLTGVLRRIMSGGLFVDVPVVCMAETADADEVADIASS